MPDPPPSSFRSVSRDISGVRMHARISDGTAAVGTRSFVLVHGLGMSGRYLMPTAKLLAPHRSVFVPDLPGFGQSGKPHTALSVPELSNALAEWMESHELGPAILLGNSLGAQVIIDFAVRHPERVERAVLVGPTIDPDARKVLTQLWRLFADILGEPKELYWMGLTDFLSAGFGRCLATLRHALEDPVVEKLPRISHPVLVVRGGRDPIVPQPWVERVADLIPDARLVILPNAAHAVNFNSPESLVKEVLGFCDVI